MIKRVQANPYLENSDPDHVSSCGSTTNHPIVPFHMDAFSNKNQQGIFLKLRQGTVIAQPCPMPAATDASEGPLTIAVVGRAGAGKTALVSALLSASGAAATAPRPAPREAAVPPVVSRVLRSRVVSTVRGAFGAVRRLIGGESYGYFRNVLGADLAGVAGAVVWDCNGMFGKEELGVVDVVLFVTRLDDGRIAKTDRILMVELVRAFGTEVLESCLFVCTHGCALPPLDLTYPEFVRGRRDVLWRFVMDIVPPLKTGEFEVETWPGEEEEAVENERAESVNESVTDDGVGVAESPEGPERPENLVPVYADPPAPEMLVVELSSRCPRDPATGAAVLPDGTAWLPPLLEAIQDFGNRSRARAAEWAARAAEEASRAISTASAPRRRAPWMAVWRHLVKYSRDGRWILGTEAAIIVVLVQLSKAVEKWEAQARERRAGRSDILLELSDEEYAALTRDDGPQTDPADDNEPLDAEREFFGDANETK